MYENSLVQFFFILQYIKPFIEEKCVQKRDENGLVAGGFGLNLGIVCSDCGRGSSEGSCLQTCNH